MLVDNNYLEQTKQWKQAHGLINRIQKESDKEAAQLNWQDLVSIRVAICNWELSIKNPPSTYVSLQMKGAKILTISL